LYFRNYKKALIKVKTIELEKDFGNDWKRIYRSL
jgi:hypothetical protein